MRSRRVIASGVGWVAINRRHTWQGADRKRIVLNWGAGSRGRVTQELTSPPLRPTNRSPRGRGPLPSAPSSPPRPRRPPPGQRARALPNCSAPFMHTSTNFTFLILPGGTGGSGESRFLLLLRMNTVSGGRQALLVREFGKLAAWLYNQAFAIEATVLYPLTR